MSGSLVIQLARLGDLLQSLPLCRALRAAGPVTVVTAFDPGPRLRAEADRWVVLDPAALAAAADAVAFRRRLAEAWGGAPGWDEPADRVVCLNEDRAATALAGLLRSRRRAGAGVAGDPYPLWLHALAGHRAHNRLQLSEAMLAIAPGSAPPPPPPALPPGAGPVVLHPGSGSPARRLPAAFWRDLGIGLWRMSRRRLCITGGPAEESEAEALAEGLGGAAEVENRCGGTDLDELQELLAAAALVVAQDTGVLHLAAHLRRPLLGLYHGSASPWETAPWQDGAHLLWAREDCAPCLEGLAPCGDYHCRGNLEAGETAALAAALLAGGPAALPERRGRLHLICRADSWGLRPVPAAGVPDPTNEGMRAQQLALLGRRTATEEQPVAGRPAGRAGRLERARVCGTPLADWRRREWPRPPRDLAEAWVWRREAVLLAGPEGDGAWTA